VKEVKDFDEQKIYGLVKWSGVNAFVMPREEGGGSLTLGF
jgi:hypothetical protein